MSDLKFNKVVVTGGSGKLGGFVVAELIDKCQLTVLDIKPPEQDVPYINADITDLEAMKKAFEGADAVVHLAAVPNPRTLPADVTFRTNVQGCWAVLEAAEQMGVKQVVVASSDASTGLHYNPADWKPQYLPIDEDHPLRPTEFYGLSKQITEVICESYANRGKMNVIAIRPTHIVFEHEWPEIEARGSDPDNYHLWSYVEPEDVAQAFRLALTRDDIRFDKFIIAAADTMSESSTLGLVENLVGHLPEVRRPELFAELPTANTFDIARARERLGYAPKSDWRKMIERRDG